MSRFRTIHLLPALLIAVLSLAVPVLGAGGDGAVAASAGSYNATTPKARAAQAGLATDGATRFPVGSAEMESAKATATAYWGAAPCGGNYQLQWVPLDAGTNATASWRNPTDAWANAGQNFDCRIDINPGADFDYAKLCTVLTHEIGHLVGQQHDPNAGQLMSAYYTAPIAQCEVPGSAAATTAPGVEDADDAESDWDVAATSAPKRQLRKKTTAKTKSVKRCKVVKKSGKRVKRCRTVRAKKAVRTSRAR